MTTNYFRLHDSMRPKDYKRLYRVTLDEVSALLEENRLLESKVEELKKLIPAQIMTLNDSIVELDGQSDDDAQPPSRTEITPLALQLKSKAPFDKLVLSLGKYGTIKESKKMESLKLIFDGDCFSNLRDDKEDYLSQFLPMIVEDLRSKIVQRFAEIEKTLPTPNIADVSRSNDESGNEPRLRRKRHHKHQEDMQFVMVGCTSLKSKFPKLDHGFNKELLCVILPTSSVNPKSLNMILAIGTAVPSSDPADENVDYMIKMLAHDYQHLLLHERNVHQSDTVSRLHWHHLVGLIPSARMYEACKPNAPLLFPQQILYHQQVEWPAPGQEGFNLPTSLNETQSNVVKSFAATDERGMFYLVGPPGTGKTTTIAQLLIERVRRYPDEKILLTAPSNKAIQVVLHKLMEKLKEKGSDIAVAVIGTGKLSSPDHEMLSPTDFTSGLIKRFDMVLRSGENWRVRMKQLTKAVDTAVDRIVWLLGPDRAGLRVEQECSVPIKLARQWFSNTNYDSPVDEDSLKEYIHQCKQQLQRVAGEIESFILQKAHIVFGTLVASGRKSLAKIVRDFDTVIVDEASQALLPATFIPFKFGPARYLLVGDPQQLPATVNADKLKALGYADSLMLVMKKHGGADKYAVMLTTQYRMHPSICKPISDLFYDGKLVTAESVMTRPSALQRLPPRMALSALPSAFIDVESVEYKEEGGSTYNYDEAVLVVKMVRYLLEHGIKPSQIGVNTGYKAQVLLIQELLDKMVWDSARLRDMDLRELAVSTVDGFQGDERDFILFSCVRTNTHSVGFLKDHRRINVALSRARHACWVFGQRRCLAESNSSIRDFLDCAGKPIADSNTPPVTVVPVATLLSSMEERSITRWGPLPASAPISGVKRGPPAEQYRAAAAPTWGRTVQYTDSPTSVASSAVVVTPPRESFVVQPARTVHKPRHQILTSNTALIAARRK